MQSHRTYTAVLILVFMLTGCGGGIRSSSVPSLNTVGSGNSQSIVTRNGLSVDCNPAPGSPKNPAGVSACSLQGYAAAQLQQEQHRSTTKPPGPAPTPPPPTSKSIIRGTQSNGTGALVLYDTAGQWGYLGELYATAAGNLAGHFGAVKAEPVSSYTSGQMSSYAAAIYIGSTYYCPGCWAGSLPDSIPASFYTDVAAGHTPVVWMNDNIWNMANAIGPSNFIHEYGWDPTNSYFAPNGSVGNVTQVQYQSAAGGGNANLTRTIPAGFDGGILHPYLVGGQAQKLAQAHDSAPGGGDFPWAIRSGNLTYIGEIPFVYVSESDRVLAFEDLLFDALAPQTQQRHRAMLRLEEIDAKTDPVNLCAIATYLAGANIPYGFNFIPLFEDPLGKNADPVNTILPWPAAGSLPQQSTPPSGGTTEYLATPPEGINFSSSGTTAGESMYFSAVMQVGGLDNNRNDQLYFQNSKIAIGSQIYSGPDTIVTFSPTATTATMSYSAANNLITETLPTNFHGNAFLGAMIVPGPIPAAPTGSNTPRWYATVTMMSSNNNLHLTWQYAAALYKSLGTNYGALGIKLVDDNTDFAGVPESVKSLFVGGAGTTGGGNWSKYTGALTEHNEGDQDDVGKLGDVNCGIQPGATGVAALAPVISYMLANGGVMVDDGYTHQLGTAANPYSGVSGEDAEFFQAALGAGGQVMYTGPDAGDSTAFALGRVNSALAAIANAGYPAPKLWSTPNYFASDVDYRAFGQKFAARYERSVYFSGDLSGGTVNYTQFIGQFFPYVVHDAYGTEVIPENLGGFVPTAGLNSPMNTANNIVNNANLNLVVRDGFASFFFDPLYGGPNDLQQIVNGIKGKYTFVAPSASL